VRFTARQHNNKKCFDTTDARCKHEHNTMLSSVSPCQLNYYVHSYTSPSISPFSSQDSSIPKRDILQTLPEPGRGAFKCKNSYQLLDTHHIIPFHAEVDFLLIIPLMNALASIVYSRINFTNSPPSRPDSQRS